jgi:hypothetical protein
MQSKPVSQMTKIEMEAKIKGYKFVLFKLHREIAEKDTEIARLTQLLERKAKNG